jgi:putative endonuclease
MMKRQTTGQLGEKLAAEFLAKQGYQIIETNFRCKEGEVDIIAKDRDCLAFVEVRTKTSRMYGTPEESVTARKKEHLRNTAARYLEIHPEFSALWRIDFVAVELTGAGKVLRLEVLKNAVEGE